MWSYSIDFGAFVCCFVVLITIWRLSIKAIQDNHHWLGLITNLVVNFFKFLKESKDWLGDQHKEIKLRNFPRHANTEGIKIGRTYVSYLLNYVSAWGAPIVGAEGNNLEICHSRLQQLKMTLKKSWTTTGIFDKSHDTTFITQKSKTNLVLVVISSTSLNMIDPTSFPRLNFSLGSKIWKCFFLVLAPR